MNGLVVALPGDGVGPEVIAEAERLLALVAPDLRVERYPFGGAAMTSAAIRCRPRRLQLRAALTRCCWARSAGLAGTAVSGAPRKG